MNEYKVPKMYRFFAYVLLLTIISGFISCSDDDAKAQPTILGTWRLSSWTLETPIDLNNDGELETSFAPACLNGSELQFMDGSNGSLFFSSIVAYNTSNENGTLVYMTTCATDADRIPETFSYTNDGQTLLINLANQTYVLTLGENKLSLLIPDGFKASDIHTFETSISQDITFHFTRY